MTPERVFAKLAARVPPIANAGGATGAPEIDTSMAASMCAGLDDALYDAAVAKWACCDAALQRTRYRLQMVAMERSQMGWVKDVAWVRVAKKIKAHTGQPASTLLADMAISEMAAPYQWTHSLRQSILGVPASTYYRRVAPRYAEIASVLDEWTETARQHVYRAQKD